MISVEHVRTMARYNAWQNRSLYGAADTLSETARRQDRGAFFGSIQGTLSHLMWGDQQWMSRFTTVEKPNGSGKDSPTAYPDWDVLKAERTRFDGVITDWAEKLDQSWLNGNVRWYSGLAKADLEKPAWFLVTHFFNHQTHHRGQVHAMLTAAGAKPDDTDLMLMK
jgi:uncharacterized damage-inducible protein DinB